MAHYEFFQNKKCEYFPCHENADSETFSCLFCFCPLYPLAENCGGNFSYTKQGIKDCSGCLRPHMRENYRKIIEDLRQVQELAKKNPTPTEIP